jgi:hypothetical protein
VVVGVLIGTWAANWIYWNVINPEPLDTSDGGSDSGTSDGSGGGDA